MLIDRYQRGDSFVFTAAPVDASGDPVMPGSVKLYVNYLNGDNERVETDPITMTLQTDGSYFGEWTSLGIEAAAGRVYWSIQAISPDSNASGYFELDANLANPA